MSMESLAIPLTEALTRMIDLEALTQAKFAWCRAADGRDPDGMVERFVEDCTASYEPGGEVIVGREALRAWNRNRLVRVTASSHHISNFEVRYQTPNEVTTYCYLNSWQHFDDHPATPDRTRYGRYIDTWVRRDGLWWQRSLKLLVAGEWNFGDVPRFGEYVGWDVGIDL